MVFVDFGLMVGWFCLFGFFKMYSYFFIYPWVCLGPKQQLGKLGRFILAFGWVFFKRHSIKKKIDKVWHEYLEEYLKVQKKNTCMFQFS